MLIFSRCLIFEGSAASFVYLPSSVTSGLSTVSLICFGNLEHFSPLPSVTSLKANHMRFEVFGLKVINS